MNSKARQNSLKQRPKVRKSSGKQTFHNFKNDVYIPEFTYKKSFSTVLVEKERTEPKKADGPTLKWFREMDSLERARLLQQRNELERKYQELRLQELDMLAELEVLNHLLK